MNGPESSGPGMCRFVEQSLWKYIDRELSARKVSQISAHLKCCSTCEKLYETRAREATMYRLAFMGSPFGSEFCERFEETLLYEIERFPVPDVDPGTPAHGSTGVLAFLQRYPVLASVAATVVLVALLAVTVFRLGALYSNRSPRVDRGQLAGSTDAGGGVAGRHGTDHASVEKSARSLGLLQRGVGDVDGHGLALFAGRGYTQSEIPEVTRLVLDDDSSLTFSARPFSLLIHEDSSPKGDFVATMEYGAVDVQVTKRLAGSRRFTLLTPNAEVNVLGTEFTLEVHRVQDSPGGVLTSVAVTEGKVRVTDLITESVQVLESGSETFRIPAPPPSTGWSNPDASPASTTSGPSRRDSSSKHQLDSPFSPRRPGDQ